MFMKEKRLVARAQFSMPHYFRRYLPLKEFKSYAETIEKFFSQHTERIKHTKEELVSIAEFDYWSLNSEELEQYSNGFPNLLRTSLFTSLYSFLESTLMNICKENEQKYPDKIKLSDLKHNGVKKAEIYINKVMDKQFPSESDNYKLLGSYNKIRNYFTHNTNSLKEYPKIEELKKVVTFVKGVKLDEVNDTLLIDNTFCLEFISTINNLLTEVFTIIYGKHDGGEQL
jgi:hypothetical protein